MKTIGLILLAALFASSCNNSANDTNQSTDSAAARDKTQLNMTDTNRRLDTSPLPNKMQDTGIKK